MIRTTQASSQSTLRHLRGVGMPAPFRFSARVLALCLIVFFICSQWVGLQHRNNHISTFLGKSFTFVEVAGKTQVQEFSSDRSTHSCSLFEAANIADCIANPALDLITAFPHQLSHATKQVVGYNRLFFLHFSSRAPPFY
jgi:hypothetical protein